jgi:hypothetical protein
MEANLRILQSFKKINEKIEDNEKKQKETNDQIDKSLNNISKEIKELDSENKNLKKELVETIEKVKKEKPIDGKDGKDGRDGKNGYTPVKGIDYFDGRDGKDGKNGRDGADGADGKDGSDGRNGKDGANGKDGTGIYNIEINSDGELIITLTDGKKKNCGVVVGRDGFGYNGNDGVSVTNAEIIDRHLIITLSNGKKIDAGLISGSVGEEVDPTVPDYVKNITKEDIEKWNNNEVDLSNYYNKDEINGLANELLASVPEVIPLEEYNPEEQYADNQITNANTMNYVIGTVTEAFNEVYENIEGVREEAQQTIFTVNYTLNPQDMTVVSQSHYSGEIIQAFNEGKKVSFKGYVLGLNVYVVSELELVDGQYAFTYPLLRINLGEGEKNYFFKVQISSNSASVEMNEIGEGSGTDDTIFLVEYNINLSVPQVTYVSKTQQEIVNAYNDGKKVMFRGTVTGSSTILVSELNSVDSGLPYTYPFMRTDLGEGIYNYFFRVSVYREFGNIEAYALVDMNRLKQTEANFQNSLSNLAMSRPDTNTVTNIVNYYVNEIMKGYQNRLLPENADEGTILKYVDGSWTAVEDNTFTVEYQLNPQTMTITEISNYSDDIIEAYNNGKTVNFRCYVLGLGVYVSSDLNLIDGTIAYTMPIVRGDLGQGMMNYLFRVGVRASSTFVEVRVLQDIG